MPPHPDRRIAVVMITRDRAAEAVDAARRARELPERPRVVVVDDGSIDGTSARVHDAVPDAIVVRLDRSRGAAARNVGVPCGGARYVAFCDDDMWWEPGALAAAADVLDAHRRVGLVAAQVLVEPGGRRDPVTDAMATSPLPADATLPGPRVLGFLAGATVVRVAAFRAAGGFEPGFGVGGEETALACRMVNAGWELVHVPAVVAHHRPSAARDPDARARRELRNAVWTAWLCAPLGAATARTLRLAHRARREPTARAALLGAIGGAPRIGRRRVAPTPRVREWLALLDAAPAADDGVGLTVGSPGNAHSAPSSAPMLSGPPGP